MPKAVTKHTKKDSLEGIPAELITRTVARLARRWTTAEIVALIAGYGYGYDKAREILNNIKKMLQGGRIAERRERRAAVGLALEQVIRESLDSATPEFLVARLEDAGASPEAISVIVRGWDPNGSYKVALKALDQYSRLYGLNEPERIEIEARERIDPKEMTQLQRRKEIEELEKKYKKHLDKSKKSDLDKKD